jgi:serine/threonine protein kinase
MINRTVRNFEIKELIATGGMAAIYKAVQVSLDRVVAIKILHGHLAQDQNFITRFEREAKAAANLQHENIVNIIDFGKAEDVYFIAMEYVEGRSLKDLIASIKFIPLDIALTIAHAILQGLDHAHKKGVVHRDIKPANILISHNGVAKIADFGLAQAQDLTSVTITGSIVGTPAYMSPEQAGGRKVDIRTDIFSLGVVLYEMITGIKPFAGDNYSSVIHEILTVEPPKPMEANPLIPDKINDIIIRMLEKDIDQRYQTAGEISDDITAYCKQRNIEVTRNRIGEFLKKPDKEFENLVAERKGKHFERALYFEKQGDDKIDSALREYSKVLHLDPRDAQAQKRLHILQEKKKKVKPKPHPAPAPPAEMKKERPGAAVPAKRKNRLPVYLISSLVILIVLGLAWRAIRRRHLRPAEHGPVGTVMITSVPDSAGINVDDTVLDHVTPWSLDSLSIGDHTIRITMAGYQPFTQTITIKGYDTVSVKAILVQVVTPERYGSFSITSTPRNAVVFIDGERTGKTTPCTIEQLAVGSHTIRLTKKDYDPIEVSREVQADTKITVSLSLSKTAHGQEPPPPPQTSFLKVTAKPWAKIYIDDRYI